ncbi:MAG: hypothetical protein L0Z50_01610, partial [Verrucomicrobiales bacterium]|nr:hypothetical protein [Verrucomicrobiales bacterium]
MLPLNKQENPTRPSIFKQLRQLLVSAVVAMATTAAFFVTAPVNTRLIAQYQTDDGNTVIIKKEDEVGGFPTSAPGTAYKDTDHDGMPDAWETARGLDPNIADNNGDADGDGYTNLEEFLNGPTTSTAPRIKVKGREPEKSSDPRSAFPTSARVLETPRQLPRLEDLGREPRPNNNYGSMGAPLQALRAHRPLDLNAAEWRRQHPAAPYDAWARKAQAVLAEGLHHDTGKLALNAVTTARWETDSFVRETIEFNTTPWFRVPGYFYIPKNVPLPAPALIVFHEWGGPMLFGADRVSGEPLHPAIIDHRQKTTSGLALADWFAAHG